MFKKRVLSCLLCTVFLAVMLCSCSVSAFIQSLAPAPLDDNQIISQYSRYGFDSLSQTEKQIYREIASAITAFEEDRLISTTDITQIDNAFDAVMLDHPEYFYADGYKIKSYGSTPTAVCSTFTPTYTVSKQQYQQKSSEIENAIEIIMANVPSGDDYTKVKYAYENIILNTSYVSNSPDNQNIYSVLVNHNSVCAGYAKTMQLLLNKMQIECTYVTGVDLVGGDTHAWNFAKLDGDYYHIDATFGDPITENADAPQTIDIFYEFLAMTDDFARLTRTFDNKYNLPAAVSTKDNYYVREGCYFENYDTQALLPIFLTAAQNGKKAVWLSFSDEQVYSLAIYGLFGKYEIMDILNQCKAVNPTVKAEQIAYYQDDELYTIVILL